MDRDKERGQRSGQIRSPDHPFGMDGPPAARLTKAGSSHLLALSGCWCLVGLAVALGTYPLIRRLTKRLNVLQSGVEQWGQGDLSTRVEVSGNDEVAFLAERFNTPPAALRRWSARTNRCWRTPRTNCAHR